MTTGSSEESLVYWWESEDLMYSLKRDRKHSQPWLYSRQINRHTSVSNSIVTRVLAYRIHVAIPRPREIEILAITNVRSNLVHFAVSIETARFLFSNSEFLKTIIKMLNCMDSYTEKLAWFHLRTLRCSDFCSSENMWRMSWNSFLKESTVSALYNILRFLVKMVCFSSLSY